MKIILSLSRLSFYLLVVIFLSSMFWLVTTFSIEALISVLTSVAGMLAGYKKDSPYKNLARLFLTLTLFFSLYWTSQDLDWEPIINVLLSVLGLLATFDESAFDQEHHLEIRVKADDATLKKPLSIAIANALGFTRKLSVHIQYLILIISWMIVWWRGVQISNLPSAVDYILFEPNSYSWVIQSDSLLIIWNVVVITIVVYPFWTNAHQEKILAEQEIYMENGLIISSLIPLLIIGVLNAWAICICYMAQSYVAHDGSNIIIAIITSFAMILFAHALIIGFVSSIGAGIIGIILSLISIILALSIRYSLWILMNLIYRVSK